jgi:hypothetical protein
MKEKIVLVIGFSALLLSLFSGLSFSTVVKASLLESIKTVDYENSSTPVGGIISENTTWTLENSPYIFVDTVTIAPDVTLTIEPGVTVDMDFWSLRVEGTLRAVGNETHRIKIKALEQQLDYSVRIYFADISVPWNEATNTGCIIEYVDISFWCLPYGIYGGFPKISNNLMYFTGETGISTDGMISNNTIKVNGYRAIYVKGSASILYNIIEGDMTAGIFVGEGADSPTIIGNLIKYYCWNGIVLSGGWRGNPYIANNTVVNCRNGLNFPHYLTPEGMDRASVVYNNIYGNVYTVEVGKEDPRITINIPYNWWGTTNTSLIDKKIYDQKDDRRLSLINYTAFMVSPAYFPLDVTPPKILEIAQEPQRDNVGYFQNVTVIANITDDVTGVNEVILSYTVNAESPWFNVTMNYNSTLTFYEAVIPGHPLNKTIRYIVIAYDYAGNCKVDDYGGQYYVYTVIPEFPSAIILSLFVVLTMFATVFVKKRLLEKT